MHGSETDDCVQFVESVDVPCSVNFRYSSTEVKTIQLETLAKRSPFYTAFVTILVFLTRDLDRLLPVT